MIQPIKPAVAGRLAAGVCLLLALAPARASEYIHEDVRIQGKEIHSFEAEGGQPVSVVLGDFRLTAGKHVVSGRDAVVWVQTRPTSGGLGLHDIEVYVEGEARVQEPEGASTTDQTMFVTIRCRGRLTATGTMSDRPLRDFPLYRRALAARKQAHEGPATATGPAEPPPLVVSTQPAPARGDVSRPGGAPAVTVSKPQLARPVQPVHFHAEKFTSQEVGEGQAKRRVTIARGNVYLSQGNPDGELFLELRAQAAVVFSQRRKAQPKGGEDGGTVPWAPKVQGMETAGGEEEAITGVYLDGDVVISRGERYLRGPSAYYDFTTSRALMVQPVFRVVQEQRNIPVFIRADEARILSDREVEFRNAKVSTSDFYTPSYHIGAREVYLKNTTPYDQEGVRLGEHGWLSQVKDATFNVGGVPLAYWPESRSDVTAGHSPLRRATVGSHGELGFGGETQWHLFRLLGLLEPKGVHATLDLNWYERGPFAGIDVDYDRQTFHGYSMIYGLVDQDRNDDFGHERRDVAAPEDRGRWLTRHKQYLSQGWEMQFELSYICDRNYLEAFFPDEHFAGKEQETLLYAKKQRDNWAFTTLLKYRMNRFQTQTESAPDLGAHLIGQSLADDRLTLFSEAHGGALRHRIDEGISETHGRFMGRADTRDEIDWPVHLGPLNVVPYAAGRATYWSDRPEIGDVDYAGLDEDGSRCRLYGQLGLRTNMNFWRVYRDVQSRLWDLHGLKHVITPEVVAFLGESAHGVGPRDLFPMDPDIEQHLGRLSGVAAGVSQRLQTKRGSGQDRRIVDWMRLDVLAGFYDTDDEQILPPADGRFFFSRPEYSIPRNHVNFDYTWNISDSTAFLADGNFDTDTMRMRRWDLGLAVARDPRFRYYLGIRTITDLDSSVLTGGFTYQINEKYSVTFFEQIDVDFDGHRSLGTYVTVVRKFPRWYVGTTFVLDRRTDSIGLYLSIWPEGIPELHMGSGRTSLLAESSLN